MKGSFRRRVATAAAMLVGFYVLAGLVAFGLLGLAVAMWVTDLPQNIWLTAACAISGLAILGGLIPSRNKFEEPGPRLAEDEQPELHELVREVAAATGQEPPADVYLAADVNAAVTDTGGLLGSGGRRVMIVGLPLLDVLTVGQLRAVLAHEFGHYYGGDTRLGPWFFRTYDAIARTVTNLEAAESMWQKPFELYGEFFLRRSSAIKRQQEFMADELAAKAAGKQAAVECLQRISAAAPAYDHYWESEVVPVLGAGSRAPLLEGFRGFRSVERVREAMDESVRAELESTETDPYSTHPSLPERLAALEKLPDDERGATSGDERPALSLLRDPERAERDLLRALFGDETADAELLRWDDVPQRVIVPGWREMMDRNRPALAGITVGGIPDVALSGLPEFGRGLPLPPGIPPEAAAQLPGGVYAEIGAAALDVALGLALHEAGWAVHAPVGEPVVLRRDGQTLEPFGTAEALASGELTRDRWRARCVEAGIAELPLAGGAGTGQEAMPATAGG